MRIRARYTGAQKMSKFFRSFRAVVITLVIFSATLPSAFAGNLAFEGGQAVIHGETPALGLSVSFGHRKNVGADHQDFNYECGLLFIAENGPNPHQIAASCLVVDRFKRFDLGFGLAALQNEDEWSSGRINFSLLARYRFTERLSLSWRHFSNAGTQSPNIGRDVLLLGWTF